MRPVRSILLTIGVLATLMGVLWIGQGLGFVHWPKSSFMLDQRVWADYGAMAAVVGLILIMVGRRLRR